MARNTRGLNRSGRKPGTPNKFNSELKAMILGALADAGGQKYLKGQAKKTPTAFLGLVGKVLPLQVTGDEGKPLFPEGGLVINIPKLDGADNRT